MPATNLNSNKHKVLGTKMCPSYGNIYRCHLTARCRYDTNPGQLYRKGKRAGGVWGGGGGEGGRGGGGGKDSTKGQKGEREKGTLGQRR